ncbi:MAG: hypothetical protein ACLGI5_10025 [Thermoleophilia bacterium]
MADHRGLRQLDASGVRGCGPCRRVSWADHWAYVERKRGGDGARSQQGDRDLPVRAGKGRSWDRDHDLRQSRDKARPHAATDVDRQRPQRNNPSVVTDDNKEDIARACEKWVTAKASNRTIVDCTTPGIPIYVIGREWPQAADHTIEAQESYAPWVLLTYTPRTRTKWYVKYPETGKTSGSCEGRYLQPNPAATACDEWPWQKTEEGGETPSTGRLPHLKIINALQNSASGNRWDGFLNKCEVKIAKAAPTPTNGAGRFLVIPLPSWMPQSFESKNVCNGVTTAS